MLVALRCVEGQVVQVRRVAYLKRCGFVLGKGQHAAVAIGIKGLVETASFMLGVAPP